MIHRAFFFEVECQMQWIEPILKDYQKVLMNEKPMLVHHSLIQMHDHESKQ